MCSFYRSKGDISDTPNSEELNPKFFFPCCIIAANTTFAVKTHLTLPCLVFVLLIHKAYFVNKEKAPQLHKPGMALKSNCTLKAQSCPACTLPSIPGALVYYAPCSHCLTCRLGSQGAGVCEVCTLLTKFTQSVWICAYSIDKERRALWGKRWKHLRIR